MVSPGVPASAPPGAETPADPLVRRLTIGFCLVALVLGALQAWMGRLDMNPDGIQYLDNAAAYWHRDFQHALNTQWSPLYPWLIGALSAITHPTPEQEFPLAHLLNFLIYAASLLAFLFFFRSLLKLAPASTSYLALSYSAFLYCSLDFTSLRMVAPDLLVSTFAFLTAGLVARIAFGHARVWHFSTLGLVLSLGYLSKAPFLPFGLFSLLIAAMLGGKRVLLAAAVFVATATPYFGAMSQAKGRFTLGDSAKLNLAWQVNGLPNTNWQGGPEANGWPVHPTHQLSKRPAIFEFATPIAGTYPPWYDPAYWNEGVEIAYRSSDFARATLKQIGLYGYWLHHRQLSLVFAWLALFLLSSNKIGRLKPLWPLLALGALPFAMYAPVHAESRYLAPFFVLLWTALFAGVLDNGRVSLAIATTAAVLMLGESVTATFADPANQPPARLHYQIARDLKALGLKPGDQVAIVTGDLPYYWARLASCRVSLEVSFSNDYRERQNEWTTVRDILSSQPATFLVSPALDGVTDQPGWRQLEGSNVFAYPIHPSLAY